jgi:hypothetical protein
MESKRTEFISHATYQDQMDKGITISLGLRVCSATSNFQKWQV